MWGEAVGWETPHLPQVGGWKVAEQLILGAVCELSSQLCLLAYH